MALWNILPETFVVEDEAAFDAFYQFTELPSLALFKSFIVCDSEPDYNEGMHCLVMAELLASSMGKTEVKIPYVLEDDDDDDETEPWETLLKAHAAELIPLALQSLSNLRENENAELLLIWENANLRKEWDTYLQSLINRLNTIFKAINDA
jgi:hypothetical protein